MDIATREWRREGEVRGKEGEGGSQSYDWRLCEGGEDGMRDSRPIESRERIEWQSRDPIIRPVSSLPMLSKQIGLCD